MPWDSRSFAAKHNHALHGEAASKAASIANAILRETGDEGKAIRIANARARAEGGGADDPETMPKPGPDYVDPMRYIGGYFDLSHGDYLIREPNDYTPAPKSAVYKEPRSGSLQYIPPASPYPRPRSNEPIWDDERRPLWVPKATPGYINRGGQVDAALSIARRAAGGMAPRMPSLGRQQPMQPLDERPYGFTVGQGGGRTDSNDISVAPGSYVLPADIISGLGEGNSLAGAKVWDTMLNSMPWGIQPVKLHGKSGAPSAPHDASLMQGITGGGQPQFADGGETSEVPIRSADGETILSDEDVLRVGQFYAPPREIEAYPGSHDRIMSRGQRILDDWIKHERGKNIKHLKGLAGPVGSKNASQGHI